MNPSTLRVLNDLKKAKNKGITFDSYPQGFRLGARVFDLRQIGHKIVTIKERLAGDVIRARYVLVFNKPKL